MPDPSYQKIALISDTVTGKEVTIPTESIEHDAENDINGFAEPNRDGGDANKRSLLNLNKISSQGSPKVSLTNESVRELNKPNAIGGEYPSSERSWLPNDTSSVQWRYAKEAARGAIEDMRESGNLLAIDIFDIRAITEDGKEISKLRNSAPSGSTARWPNTDHPTYRRYKGYIKSTKFRERGNETGTRYDLDLVFEIGLEQG